MRSFPPLRRPDWIAPVVDRAEAALAGALRPSLAHLEVPFLASSTAVALALTAFLAAEGNGLVVLSAVVGVVAGAALWYRASTLRALGRFQWPMPAGTQGPVPPRLAERVAWHARSWGRAAPPVRIVAEPRVELEAVMAEGLGGPRTEVLCVGAPLLVLLDEASLDAVIARELAASTSALSWVDGWLWRWHGRWARFGREGQVVAEDDESHERMAAEIGRWSGLARSWLLPMAQSYEVALDRIAGERLGVAVLGESCCGAEVAAALWVRYLAESDQRASEGQGVGSPLAGVRRWAEQSDPDLRYGLLGAALSVGDSPFRARGALLSRLDRWGVGPRLPASEGLAFGATEAEVEAWSAALYGGLVARWREEFARAQVAEDKLRWWAGRDPQTLSVEERYERAALLDEHHLGETVEMELIEVVRARPDHAAALWRLGRRLIWRHNPEGVALVRRAVEAEPALWPLTGFVRDWLDRKSRVEEAREWEARMRAHEVEREQLARSLTEIGPGDRLEPLSEPAIIAALGEGLAGASEVEEAFVGWKPVPGRSMRLLVVALVPKRRLTWWGPTVGIPLAVQASFHPPGIELVLVRNLARVPHWEERLVGATVVKRSGAGPS